MKQIKRYYDIDGTFVNPFIPKSSTYIFNYELPLPLTNSNFPSNLINKSQLTIRVYFRGNITTSALRDNDIKVSDLKLMLRMKESSHIYKEPRYDHLFTKKMVTKINIPSLSVDNFYNFNITGFSNIASFALVFIREQDNNI